jgi:cytohesin
VDDFQAAGTVKADGDERSRALAHLMGQVRTYRVAAPTGMLVYGMLALVLIFGASWALFFLNRSTEARYAVAAGAIAVVLLAIAVRRRLAARASQSIKIDGDAITASSPAGFRVLPWGNVAHLRVTHGGALELSDASGVMPITVSRRFEPFRTIVVDVLLHLEASYDTRTSAARGAPPTQDVTFASSVMPEVWQVLGGLAWTAGTAWWESAAFVVGLISMPVTLWRLGRVPYAITVQPTAITLTSLAWTREIPIAHVAKVAFGTNTHGRPVILIDEAGGTRIAFAISRLTERPLELYDLLRGRHESPASAVRPDVVPLRLAPRRAAMFFAACLVAALAVASVPLYDGGVLRLAAEYGYTRVAKIVLLLGSPVDFRGPTRRTPLYLAARNGHVAIVTMLLARGADPAARCRDEEFTPLHVAAQYGHLAIAGMLLDAGAPPDVRNRYGRTPLWETTWVNRSTDVAIATLLANRGASVDSPDDQGVAPIYQAVQYKNMPMVRFLVTRGARLDAKTTAGFTASWLAVEHGCVECLRLLAQGGADMNARSTKGGQTLLIRAAKDGNPQIIALLLDGGAQPNLAANDGYEALHTAVWNGHKETVEMLLAHGADINAATEAGTPLYNAVTHRQPDLLAMLLDRGARWDLGYHGLTSLQRAARGGETVMVRMMLDRGADPNASTETQPQPIILASDQGHLDVVKLLVERGADALVQWKEWTPLKAAQVHNHGTVVSYLQSLSK